MPAQLTTGRTRIAVFISGRGSNLQSLIDASADPSFPAEIAVVISDNPDAAGLQRAATAGIAHHAINRRDYGSRADFETALGKAVRSHDASLICLAGFMRILSPGLVAQWPGKILNIHPSLLPAFKGLDTHARALEAGAKVHGATVHVVTESLDDGPIIAQVAVPVLASDTAQTLSDRVLAVEHRLYPAAVASVLRSSAPSPDPSAALFNPPLE